MTVPVATTLPATADTVVLFAFADVEPDLSLFGESVSSAFNAGFVRRKANDITPLFEANRRVIVVGLGDAKDHTLIRLKRAAGSAVRYLADRNVSAATVLAPEDDGAAGAAVIAEAAVLGSFDSGDRKSTERPIPFETLTIVSRAPGAAEAVERARIVAEASNEARRLVNCPAADLPPAELARRAVELAGACGLDARTFSVAEMEALGMVGCLAVGRGSRNAPSFTVLKHTPNPGEAPIVLVGKGLCFDSGGISLKPGADMHHMKDDMAGGAAVIGALVAAARLKLPVNVVGIIPAAENMPGGDAYRPSDVLTFGNGKTVEIVNTDAEGRLVLADGLVYGEREFKPKAIVDLATLTGACVISLGGDISGVFSADDALANALVAAGDAATEPAWRLPMYKAYRSKFDSGIADMTNAGDRWGGSITAALFLAEFVESTPFAHIDIAGPAFDDTEKAWLARGGTGYGVALLIEYLSRL
ncbi:MAG TPA: leucyl aminopeptidase [Armatimonadota bacterium]|jgi:leucyl aminopeptidase